jgi:hypothetical protein
MAPRLKCPLGPRKEPRYNFSFLSKIPANEPPPVSPTGPLWREIPVHRTFCISLENVIKIPLNKKALRKKRPYMFPKSGPPMEADAHFRASLIYLSRTSIKEPSLKVSFT